MCAALFAMAICQLPPSPGLLPVRIGDDAPGRSQRSRIEQIEITFPGQLDLGQTDVGLGLRIERIGVGNVAFTHEWIEGKDTILRVRFPNQSSVYARSLIDGNYAVHITARHFRYADGSFVAISDGGTVGAQRTPFYRFFGDFATNGSYQTPGISWRTTDNIDLAHFLAAYGSLLGMAEYDPAFDYDGDGDIDPIDWSQFKFRYGFNLNPE